MPLKAARGQRDEALEVGVVLGDEDTQAYSLRGLGRLQITWGPAVPG